MSVLALMLRRSGCLLVVVHFFEFVGYSVS